MAYDRLYLFTSLLYAIAGMLLGIVMAATQNHLQHVTHAHILLVGFVVPFIYAVLHRLWLSRPGVVLTTIQFILHQLGALVLVISLYMLFANVLPLETLEPLLASSSIAVMLGMVLMLVLLARFGTARARE